MAVRWYTNGATDRFKGNRVYRFLVESTYGGSVQAAAVLATQGRVLYIAPNQPGSSAAQNVNRTQVYFLPAASVVDRADTLGTLYATLRARAAGARVTKAEAAQVSDGARDAMWAEAGAHPMAALSVSRFEALAGPTLTEQVQRSAQGTAARAGRAADAAATAAGEALDSVTDAAGDAVQGARNTWTYTKVALGLVGVAAAAFLVTGGQPGKLLKVA